MQTARSGHTLHWRRRSNQTVCWAAVVAVSQTCAAHSVAHFIPLQSNPVALSFPFLTPACTLFTLKGRSPTFVLAAASSQTWRRTTATRRRTKHHSLDSAQFGAACWRLTHSQLLLSHNTHKPAQATPLQVVVIVRWSWVRVPTGAEPQNVESPIQLQYNTLGAGSLKCYLCFPLSCFCCSRFDWAVLCPTQTQSL